MQSERSRSTSRFPVCVVCGDEERAEPPWHVERDEKGGLRCVGYCFKRHVDLYFSGKPRTWSVCGGCFERVESAIDATLETLMRKNR